MQDFPPPIEWVDGDMSRVAQFGIGIGIWFGILLTLLVLAVLSTLGVSLNLPQAPILASLDSWWVVGALGVWLSYYYGWPRLFPVVARIGISPRGLSLVVPLHSFAVPWDQVKEIGPGWVYVVPYLRTSGRRLRLTPHQYDRLVRFVTPQ